MKRAQRAYARRQLTWMRRMEGVELIDRTGRADADVAERDRRGARLVATILPAMRFEKWQALGNDYVIVERDALPWELTPERIERICEPHFGRRLRRHPAALASRATRGHVAELRIFNPDGSEAELSGNGAREAVALPAASAGGPTQDEFSILTKAGRGHADDHAARTPSRWRSGGRR